MKSKSKTEQLNNTDKNPPPAMPLDLCMFKFVITFV